jgi:small subunit ribosomal protein S1
VLPGLDEPGVEHLGAAVGTLLGRLGHVAMPRPGLFADPDLTLAAMPADAADLRFWVARHEGALGWNDDDIEGLQELADAAQSLLEPTDHFCLVHSDFNPKNLLVDPGTLELTGLVDWEFAHAGSPYAGGSRTRSPPTRTTCCCPWPGRATCTRPAGPGWTRCTATRYADVCARSLPESQTEQALARCRARGLRAANELRRVRDGETGSCACPHRHSSIQGHHFRMTSTPTISEAPQVAVNDIGSEEDFLAAIDETIKYFNDGDIVDGTIVKVDRDEVLLDIGYKTEGVIPSRELSIKHDVDPGEVVEVGDKVEALVLQKEDKEGRLILSKKRAQYERAWGTIEKIKDEDGVVEGTVIEVVKGGLILDIGLRGFLPASLVEMRRVRDLQPYVGQTLEAKIIELDKNRNNVVLSRRAWLEQTQSEVRHGFLTQLQKGQIRKGVVSSIVNFGAFVDLGGVDGLVHVSELSWKHIDHPSEVVAVGDEVTVEVLDVDMERERVSLSLKATQEDPWQHFARTHQIGQIVPGKVTKLVPFGSFVRVEEGIEGLVHISELAERHVEIPEQVVQVGDSVMVKIIDIDLERRRISLSLKQANETATASEAEEFDPTLYGMTASYDDQGNYIYPEGFDPETGEWLEGYDEQRRAWEEQYAKAHARWEAHVKQQAEAKKAEVEAGEATSYSSEAPAADSGSLASDEALQALREKLTGGQ